MGITWRTMPLLSTLAALVIIVHSAEENLDREHRYDLRPRVLDTRPTANEQPWRVVRADPAVQRAEPLDTWDTDAPDERPVRRRVGRKRKRRPPSHSSDETELEDKDDKHDADEEPAEDTDTPVKRRKKPRPNRRNNDSGETPRPVRRRGQRRRRPSIETWPELSEFGTYPRNKKILEADQEVQIQTELDDDETEVHRYSFRGHAHNDDEYKEIRVHNRKPQDSQYVVVDEDIKNYKEPLEDKSLSEFSSEVLGSIPSNVDNNAEFEFRETNDKMRDKAPEVFYPVDKAKEHSPIDPHTLKDILKRSNGTSLSEILQQHNLTLADLLNGKENAISLFKSDHPVHNSEIPTSTEETIKNNLRTQDKIIIEDITTNVSQEKVTEDFIPEQHEISRSVLNGAGEDAFVDKNLETSISNFNDVSNAHSLTEEKDIKDDNTEKIATREEIPIESKTSTSAPKHQQRTSGMLARRPMQGTIRRKLRMRPIVNNGYKSQINRDLIALSAKRYVHHNRRNVTKGKANEWKELTPLMPQINVTEEITRKPISRSTKAFITTVIPEEITTATDSDELTETTIADETTTTNNFTDAESVDVKKETTTIAVEILATELDLHVTEKPLSNSIPPMNSSGLRRQSFNNRLKKKRMKLKSSTTEAPQDDIMKNLLEIGGLVSSSEFIARTQTPRETRPDDITETATELEDFLTTPTVTRNSMRSTRLPKRKSLKSTSVTKAPVRVTQETAKIEIQEILNDTRTSAKLSKILRERNMTLSELLEHRERGSSHVHLADIFHNASREPNPPEPFLSKSLIEPISKETYPLRALLDANSHDPATKATTVDPFLANHVNIPVIMDFGNNVNENAENMGIMSLFNNFSRKAVLINDENSTLQKDSKGTPYKSSVITVNATDDDDDATRESRMFDDEEDMISWNEIFSMIRKNHNETKDDEKIPKEKSPSVTPKKLTMEDIDGDGLIVLEDLQRLKDSGSDSSSGSDEKIQFNTLERTEILEPGILSKPPNNAKSVTVATASIVGLAMILFLLTYAALKWRQQRTISHKKAFSDERIPSPVFENRKGTKNCSSRSISPMLPTSNIYNMNTLDSQNGKDSPEYMWDTLRKPFQ